MQESVLALLWYKTLIEVEGEAVSLNDGREPGPWHDAGGPTALSSEPVFAVARGVF